MGVITDPSQHLLQTRGFGIWPDSVISLTKSSSTLLEQVLNIEYQIHSTLQAFKFDDFTTSLDSPIEDLDTLSSNAKILLAITTGGTLERFALFISLAQLSLLQNDAQSALQILSQASFGLENLNEDYIQSLHYKKFYFSSQAYRRLQDSSKEKDTLIDAFGLFETIPTLSNVESRRWLEALYRSLNRLFPTASTLQLSDIFKHGNYIVDYFNYLSTISVQFSPESLNDLQSHVSARSKQLLSSASFPNAKEKNFFELEEFLSLLGNSTLLKPSSITGLLENGISKTYQSNLILGSYVRNMIRLRKDEEATSSFEVYLDYIESYYIQHKETYFDILGMLDIYKAFLENAFIGKKNAINLKPIELNVYKKVFDQFLSIFLKFSHDHELPQLTSDFNIISHLSEDSVPKYSDSSRKFFAQLWYTVAVVNLKIYQNPTYLITNVENELKRSILYFKNSLFFKGDNDVIFQLCVFLAKLGSFKEAYQLLRLSLSTQAENTLLYFKSWHLLVLIVSIEENKDESFKLVNYLVSEVDAFILGVPNLSLVYKHNFVQIKITQLAIIEALYGVEQALDSLPGLFTLFNAFFKNDLINHVEPEANNPTHKGTSLRKTLTHGATSKLTKIISSKGAKESVGSPVKPSSNSRPKTDEEAKLMQVIWLVASSLYLRSKNIEEAEQAIAEAENVYKPTAETHSALGILATHVKPALALSEFENALVLDGDSLEAIIGISNLILNSKDDSIFVDEKDGAAAIARSKLLLESRAQSFRGSHTSEIWWLLSKIYEKYDDKERYKTSLWRSIQLEESRAVRYIGVVDFY